MPRFRDLSGLRFGRLVVVGRSGYRARPSGRVVTFSCRCDCGKVVDVPSRQLVTGTTRSCGCLAKGARSRKDSPSSVYGFFSGSPMSKDMMAFELTSDAAMVQMLMGSCGPSHVGQALARTCIALYRLSGMLGVDIDGEVSSMMSAIRKGGSGSREGGDDGVQERPCELQPS